MPVQEYASMVQSFDVCFVSLTLTTREWYADVLRVLRVLLTLTTRERYADVLRVLRVL